MSNEEDRAQKHRDASEREAAKLWRAWRTVHEMVQDRGYELAEEEVTITFDEFKRKYCSDDGSVKYAHPFSKPLPANVPKPQDHVLLRPSQR